MTTRHYYEVTAPPGYRGGWLRVPGARVGDVVRVRVDGALHRHVVASMQGDHAALIHSPVDAGDRPIGSPPLTWWGRVLAFFGGTQ